MSPRRFDYINDRPTEDVELAFERETGGEWVVSFVATVPHHCESVRVFGDLFECSLASIDHQSVPVVRGSNREAEIIHRLRAWADTDMTSDEQHAIRHARFPRMTAEVGLRRSILWFIGVLEERRQRHDTHTESRA